MRSCFERRLCYGSFSGAAEVGRGGTVQAQSAKQAQSGWSGGLQPGGVERGFDMSSGVREGTDWCLTPRAHDMSTEGSLQIGADTDDSVFAYLMT